LRPPHAAEEICAQTSIRFLCLSTLASNLSKPATRLLHGTYDKQF
jgi:hypothetical protein